MKKIGKIFGTNICKNKKNNLKNNEKNIKQIPKNYVKK